MSVTDTIVKTENFFNLDHQVKLLTVATSVFSHPNTHRGARYFAIIKDGEVEYTSPLFYGGSTEDVIRNCDSALQVVRRLLTDTQFLTGEVVGA